MKTSMSTKKSSAATSIKQGPGRFARRRQWRVIIP